MKDVNEFGRAWSENNQSGSGGRGDGVVIAYREIVNGRLLLSNNDISVRSLTVISESRLMDI